MSSTLLQPPILWQPDDYILFQKCGEITVSPDVQNIGYNCLFCTGVCLQSDTFLQHLQEHHKEDVYKLYENQNSNITSGLLNEMVVNLSDLNFRNVENINTIIALENNNEEIANEKQNYCKILNSLESKEMLTFANDLNLVYDLNANDLLTLNTSPNQEIENLVILNPLENLTSTIAATTSTLANSFISISHDYLKCVTADNECEIGDGEDSGIMLAQSPCTNSSECGGFSDCMSFTEDNSSNKSTPTHNESWKIPNFIEKTTTIETFNKKQEKTTRYQKSKYINTPAMRKALNDRELVSYLLEAYRKNEKLWNPQHPSYKYNAHRTMYNELSQPLLNDMEYSLTGVEIFGVINLLRGRYRRELTKFETRKGKHKTRLWYFEKMSFLRNVIEEKRKERKRDKELENKSRHVDTTRDTLSNREILSYLLELYRHYECLWNPKNIEYNMNNKSKIYEDIANQLLKKFNVKWSHMVCMNEIQKLRIRYRKEIRIFYKLKGLYLPKLWCFDEMDFLRPIIEERITKNLKKNFNYTASKPSQRKHDFLKASEIKFNNLNQQLQFIEIYRNYTSLWDVDHPDYRSSNFRKKALSEMLEELKLTFNNKCYELQQLEKTLYMLRKDYASEKLKRLMNSSENSNKSLTTNNGLSTVLYDKLNPFLSINMGPFRCNNCQLICKTYDQYKIHKSKHDGSLPFICTLCGKGFQMPGNLTIHIRRHRRDFPYACEICKKSFATSTEVSIHMRAHTGERPYECELCNKTFKTWSFFNLHKRTHLKQSNFHCPICDKSFYERNRFTDHMNIHLNIRKHPCEKCNKSFTTIGNLKKHLELHDPVKKYKCQSCGKHFKQFASLRWHRKTHNEK